MKRGKKLGGVEEIPFLFRNSYLGYTMPENRSSHLILHQAPLVGGSLNFVFVHFGEFTSSFSFLSSY